MLLTMAINAPVYKQAWMILTLAVRGTYEGKNNDREVIKMAVNP
jgi:hypothetical protein